MKGNGDYYIIYGHTAYHQSGKFIESSAGKNPVTLLTGVSATFPALQTAFAKLDDGE